jgi:hypothetical protein
MIDLMYDGCTARIVEVMVSTNATDHRYLCWTGAISLPGLDASFRMLDGLAWARPATLCREAICPAARGGEGLIL